MPSQGTLSNDEKNKIKSAVSKSAYNIFHVATARIYYAYPDPNEWSYAGLQGGLAFVKDKSSNMLYFKLVDLEGTAGVVWEHQLYEDFEYNQDRPFFHSFPGDVSKGKSRCSGTVYNSEIFCTGLHDRAGVLR